MYKMVVADLDGTLVHNKKVSAKTIETINKLKEQNIIFTVATGRHLQTATPILEQLGVKGPIITVNGSMIVDSTTKKEISSFTLPDEKVMELIKLCKKMKLRYVISTTKEVIGEQNSIDSLLHVISKDAANYIRVCTFNEILESINDNVLKLLIIEEQEENRKVILEEVKKVKNIDYLFSHETFIDCISKDISKGKALESLAAYHGLKMSEIIAIGDQENDIEMIKKAGLGVAMGNAINKAKFVADFITSDVRDDGFTFMCEMFALDQS